MARKRRDDDERDSGFWAGVETGCAVELGSWVLLAAAWAIASGLGPPWGWHVGVGAMLVGVVVLWMKRKR